MISGDPTHHLLNENARLEGVIVTLRADLAASEARLARWTGGATTTQQHCCSACGGDISCDICE